MVMGENKVKVIAWYDNEWGYSNRVVEVAEQIGELIEKVATVKSSIIKNSIRHVIISCRQSMNNHKVSIHLTHIG